MKHKHLVREILNDPKFVNEQPIPLKKPNRKIRPSFPSKKEGKCPLCNEAFKVGDSVRFDLDGDVVHSVHKRSPDSYDVLSVNGMNFCKECHLAGSTNESGICLDCED